jgi:hypothetical protein
LLGWADDQGAVQIAQSSAGGPLETSAIGALGKADSGWPLVGYAMPALALDESRRGLALWYSSDPLSGANPAATSLRVRSRQFLPCGDSRVERQVS